MRISDWSSDVCSSDLLPQVSACEPCNRDKSQLEHYLLSVLSFGGNHPASSAILAGEVPRRLEKNRKLHTELANGTREVLLRTGDGTREPHAAIRRSEEHTSELQSLMRSSYAVFCLKKKKKSSTQEEKKCQ